MPTLSFEGMPVGFPMVFGNAGWNAASERGGGGESGQSTSSLTSLLWNRQARAAASVYAPSKGSVSRCV